MARRSTRRNTELAEALIESGVAAISLIAVLAQRRVLSPDEAEKLAHLFSKPAIRGIDLGGDQVIEAAQDFLAVRAAFDRLRQSFLD